MAAQEGLVEQLSQEKRQLLHLLEEPASMEVQVRLRLGGLGSSFRVSLEHCVVTVLLLIGT